MNSEILPPNTARTAAALKFEAASRRPAEGKGAVEHRPLCHVKHLSRRLVSKGVAPGPCYGESRNVLLLRIMNNKTIEKRVALGPLCSEKIPHKPPRKLQSARYPAIQQNALSPCAQKPHSESLLPVVSTARLQPCSDSR